MDYPTNLPNDAVAVNITDGSFSPFYDIIWSIKYEVQDWSPGDEYGLCFFLKDSSINPTAVGGGRGPDLGYAGTTSNINPDLNSSGLQGGLVGIGLDTNGAFAAGYDWPSGQRRSGLTFTQPNSLTLRGGYSEGFPYLNVHFPISAFSLLSNKPKVLRARLGNYGRTIYLDYREGEKDTDFINILTQDIDLSLTKGMRLTPGVSFTKPLTLTNYPDFNIKVDTFHVEGKEGDPDTTTEIPKNLTPIECDSFYSGEDIQLKPETEFSVTQPVTNDTDAGDIVMCNPVDPAALSISSETTTAGPYSVGDIITYKVTLTNISTSNQAKRVSLATNSNIFPRINITGDVGLLTSSVNIESQQSKTVTFSYKVTLDDVLSVNKSINALFTGNGTNVSPVNSSLNVSLQSQQYQFRVDTKRGSADQHVFMSIGKSTGTFNFNNTQLTSSFDDLRIKFTDNNTGNIVYRGLASVPFYLVLPDGVEAISQSGDWTGVDQVVVPNNFINDSKTSILNTTDNILDAVGVNSLQPNTIIWIWRYSADDYYKTVTNSTQWQNFIQACKNRNIKVIYLDDNVNTNWMSWHVTNTKENETTSDVNQFKLPLLDNGDYDFEVDWGDRRTDSVNYNTLSSNPGLHTYFTPGEYTITIVGQCDGWKFTDNNRLKYLYTKDWTGLTLTTPAAFMNCANYIGSTSTIGAPVVAADLSRTFERCYSLNNDNIQNWAVSNVVNFEKMFSHAYNFNINLNNWNVANASNMKDMFYKAFVFNGGVNGWSVENVVTMNSMFEQAANFNQSIRRWRPNSLQTASGFLSGNNMSFSTLNYDNLLTDWGDGTLGAVDVDMDVQVSRSVSSQNGYNTLVDAGWKINDKGLTT